jgi:hypothetical protein
MVEIAKGVIIIIETEGITKALPRKIPSNTAYQT